eukprot:CAMPEP_0195134422 /NCGR_PEP_ID=MMETSP0448-20130528/150609_1 /TAXON_ID=66468 /ORGANISM="Heterocapsa triquestra, Strain CCMP 448" /LENGTH=602 /DNA_ID=CAMNT_0040172521 /DNA_START=21 /DNA_END=1826 /DNA_ORIENTATION=+
MAPMEGEGSMAPPSMVPKKRTAADASMGDGSGGKRIEIGDDIPDEISQQDIKSMLDQADDVHIEVMNEAALKRMVLQFQRKIKYNQDMRIKHADEPDKYMKSEVDLDEQVTRFTQLATHPDLYGEFLKLDGLGPLVALLNHANTDVAVDVFQVINELTDPDVIAEVPEPDEFLKALFEAQLPTMTVDCLLRINEDQSEEDAQAVQNCLSMIENLADIDPLGTATQFSQVSKMLPWLIKRVRATTMDYNRVYSSEILGIFLQNSPASREAMIKHEGVDKLLRGVAVYRKQDPGDSEESEFVQNIFDCLCSLMLLPAHQEAFGKLQGLELMIRMLTKRGFAANLALKLTDHAVRHCPTNCQVFVEKLGLKVLFAAFMKKGPKVKGASAVREGEEHVTSIIQSLCRYCTGTAMARVLNKFMENSFEKLERLLEMHEEYARAVKEADAARLKGEMQKIDRELEVDDEEQLFLDRCDAGLFTLQQVDIILVRLVNMGNRQATEEVGKLLDVKGVPVEEVCETMVEYCSHLGSSAREEREEISTFTIALARRCNGDEMADKVEASFRKATKKEDATPEAADGAATPSPPDEADEEEEREPSPKKGKKE